MILLKPKFQILPHLEYPVMLRLVCSIIASQTQSAPPSGYAEQERFVAAHGKFKDAFAHVGFSAKLLLDYGMLHDLTYGHSFNGVTQLDMERSSEMADGMVSFIMPKFVAIMVPEGKYLGVQFTEDEAGNLQGIDLVDLEQHKIPIDKLVADWATAILGAEVNHISMVNSTCYGDGRPLLPLATACQVLVTASMAQWHRVFDPRNHRVGGPLFSQIVQPLFYEARNRFPAFFADLSAD